MAKLSGLAFFKDLELFRLVWHRPLVAKNQLRQGRHKLAHGVSRGTPDEKYKALEGATRILPDGQWGFCSVKSQRLKPESNQLRSGTAKSRALIQTSTNFVSFETRFVNY